VFPYIIQSGGILGRVLYAKFLLQLQNIIIIHLNLFQYFRESVGEMLKRFCNLRIINQCYEFSGQTYFCLDTFNAHDPPPFI